MAYKNIVNSKPKKVWHLYLLAFVLILGPIFGLNSLLNTILNALLNNPADNTTGRATINVILLVFWSLCTIIGITLAIVGLIRSMKKAKA